jgi:Flp pilus assembly protein CpaB
MTNYRVRNIVIAVVLAMLAAVFTSFYVTNYKHTVQSGEDHVDVYVAAQNIPAGTSGADANAQHLFKRKTITKGAVVPGAISDPSEISRAVATDEVLAGEQITSRRFVNSSETGILGQLKGTQRAVEVQGDAHQLLAGTLKDGDRVDLVGNFKVAVDGSDSVHFDRIVLRDLLVLKAPEAADSSSSSGLGGSKEYAVMLAVSDSQASKFWYTARNADPSSGDGHGWSLLARPKRNPADSAENIETIWTVLSDGLNYNQKRRLAEGRK